MTEVECDTLTSQTVLTDLVIFLHGGSSLHAFCYFRQKDPGDTKLMSEFIMPRSDGDDDDDDDGDDDDASSDSREEVSLLILPLFL